MWSGGAMQSHAANCNNGCAYHTTRRLDLDQVTYPPCPQLGFQLPRGCTACPKTHVRTCLAPTNTKYSDILCRQEEILGSVSSIRGDICVKPRGRTNTLERAHSAGDSLQQIGGAIRSGHLCATCQAPSKASSVPPITWMLSARTEQTQEFCIQSMHAQCKHTTDLVQSICSYLAWKNYATVPQSTQ
ncbi:unnamed protein product [Ectocarpus sp. 12 AP-2014]